MLVILAMNGLAAAQDPAVLELPALEPAVLQPPIEGRPLVKPPAGEQPTLEAPGERPLVGSPVVLPSPGRIWVDGEVLLWWLKPANLPPLVTASPPGTVLANAGVLGVPGSSVLFGGSPVNGDLRAGGRVTVGGWLNDDRTCGAEAYYFQIGSQSQGFSGGSPGILGRPFFNAGTGLPNAELVSFPGIVDGTVQASASSSGLLGAGVLGRANLCCASWGRLDALAGYRFLDLNDRVDIGEDLTSTDPAQKAAPLGTNIIVVDRFHTTNQFHGGDAGLAGQFRWNAWTLTGTARIALGTSYEQADINGATTTTVPGFPPTVHSGGLLALSSNSGSHSRDVFAVVPEARLQLAYQATPRLRLLAGYTFLYWSDVIRAGDQIDLVVNPNLLPPKAPGAVPARPAFTFQSTGIWAQGIDLGLEVRY